MTPRPEDMRGRSVLAVFAHPDDESLACGGLLAWCADLGVQVSLLCVTHGDQGRGPTLAGTRARELENACRLLGVSTVVLLEHQDGMLPWTDSASLEADIRTAIHRFRPDVVITFGEDGLYWHPDHIAVHERTTSVVAALDGDAPALYYVSMPAGAMRTVVQRAAEAIAASRPGVRSSGRALRILGVSDPDAFGALAAPPTLVVEIGDFASRKLAAIRCHRSQLNDDALALVAEGDAARLLGVEHYRRAAVGARGDAFIERFACGRGPERRT
jgi:LmbE family N-acetylglucosaminyl deacetylase